MAKIGTIIGMVLLLGIGIAVAAEEMSTESWRYKMTVEVETPEGLKTGSAVREVILHKGIKMAPEQIADVELKGEAVAVDLGKRGMLLALMRGANHGVDYGTDIFFEVFPLNKRNEGKVILTPLQYPMFVRFRIQTH